MNYKPPHNLQPLLENYKRLIDNAEKKLKCAENHQNHHQNATNKRFIYFNEKCSLAKRHPKQHLENRSQNSVKLAKIGSV